MLMECSGSLKIDTIEENMQQTHDVHGDTKMGMLKYKERFPK